MLQTHRRNTSQQYVTRWTTLWCKSSEISKLVFLAQLSPNPGIGNMESLLG